MTKPRIGFVYSDQFLNHRTPSGHPEREGRLVALKEHLEKTDLWNELQHLPPEPATADQVMRVHTQSHFDFIRETCEKGGGVLDSGDTFAVKASFDTALLAAGAVAGGVDTVLAGQHDAVFCAVRPPGHHAERDHPMGFCLFNNVAVGVAQALQVHGLERVAILDWDVHHGNGTQHIFEASPEVLFISLHQYPFYPGTGSSEERGIGKGEGFTLNIPLPAGTGEKTYEQAFDEEVLPALRKFRPQLLFISAGFDAHKDDPLGGMLLTEDSFAMMTRKVRGVAPIVSVLEGGYNLTALARSVEAHLNALIG